MQSGSGLHVINNGIMKLYTEGGAVPSDFQPAIVTGNYYFPNYMTPSTAGEIPFEQLVASPIWFSSTETWTRIGVDVLTGSGSPSELIRLGIWANGADNKPGALLLDTGSLSLENSGELEATISETLTANTLYWIGYTSNDSASSGVRGTSNTMRAITWLTGVSALSDISGDWPAYYRSIAFAALPDPFGTPDGIADDALAIWLRKV